MVTDSGYFIILTVAIPKYCLSNSSTPGLVLPQSQDCESDYESSKMERLICSMLILSKEDELVTETTGKPLGLVS